MNRLFSILMSLLIALFPVPTFGMFTQQKLTINDLLTHSDISTILFKLVHKKDRADMRLVCKQWAAKNSNWQIRPNWQCMPNELEKKYHKKRQQKNSWRPGIFTALIIFDCTYQEDIESIQWIIHNLPLKSGGIGISIESHKSLLDPAMIAIHNKKPEIARLLIEHYHKPMFWKNYYDEISVPKYIERCFYTTHNRDFSFLLYLNATWSDNAKILKKLYKQKKPTEIGQKLLITQSLEDNALQCFTFLLTQKDSKEIIRKDCINIFKKSVITYKKEFPQKLLKDKLFYLNKPIEDEHKTILDYYYAKEDSKAIALLLELGAKKHQNTL